MTSRHTHWGIEYLTNPSGRREGWHLSLQSIRRTRAAALQADLDHYVTLGERFARWDAWHALRWSGKLRLVKLTITKTGEQT